MSRSLLFALALLLMAGPALAQDISLQLGGDSLALNTAQIFVLLTVLSLAPGIAMMLTCFPFMVTVLSILRQAVGVQQAPPNMMIVSLALFLSYFVMEPVVTAAWDNGVKPLMAEKISVEQALPEILTPFRAFMSARVDPDTLATMQDAAGVEVTGETPLAALIPAFILSEIQRGFEIGFLIFLPFLIIDLVIAAILMSMGMMMVPPAVVALPFKLAFFVIADGWTLLAGALVRSYGA